jgi:dTMP kinase
VLTREPGGTLLGEDIRKVLQRTVDAREIKPEAELLLFTASRAQLVLEVLEPALTDGKHVIADRFLDSTTIYQGVARGLNPATVETINRFAVGQCVPDITFLIDIEVSESRQRMAIRGNEESLDRIEKMPDAFFQQVRDGYLQLASAEPKRFVVLDGSKKMSEISEQIWSTLTERFHGLLS